MKRVCEIKEYTRRATCLLPNTPVQFSKAATPARPAQWDIYTHCACAKCACDFALLKFGGCYGGHCARVIPRLRLGLATQAWSRVKGADGKWQLPTHCNTYACARRTCKAEPHPYTKLTAAGAMCIVSHLRYQRIAMKKETTENEQHQHRSCHDAQFLQCSSV